MCFFSMLYRYTVYTQYKKPSMIATISGKIRDGLLFATILSRIEIRAATRSHTEIAAP